MATEREITVWYLGQMAELARTANELKMAAVLTTAAARIEAGRHEALYRAARLVTSDGEAAANNVALGKGLNDEP